MKVNEQTVINVGCCLAVFFLLLLLSDLSWGRTPF
jgi:hypothetical protein